MGHLDSVFPEPRTHRVVASSELHGYRGEAHSLSDERCESRTLGLRPRSRSAHEPEYCCIRPERTSMFRAPNRRIFCGSPVARRFRQTCTATRWLDLTSSITKYVWVWRTPCTAARRSPRNRLKAFMSFTRTLSK